MANCHLLCLTVFYLSQVTLKSRGILLQKDFPPDISFLTLKNATKVTYLDPKESLNFVRREDAPLFNNLSSVVEVGKKFEQEEGKR